MVNKMLMLRGVWIVICMPDVFISYSQRDKKRRDQIVKLLEDNGLNVWFDDQNTTEGDRLKASIFPAIEACKVVLVICTKHSAKSKWVGREVGHALRHAKEILPISFGKIAFGDSFPSEFSDIKRIAVQRNFVPQKKTDLVQWVKRATSVDRCPVVTMLNIKGGVGKTVLSANLFGCLHEIERKSVLLIDLDPQHNLMQFILPPKIMAGAQADGKNVMSLFRGFGASSGDENSMPSADEIKRVAERCCYSLKHNAGTADAKVDLVPGSFELITYFLGDQHQHFDRSAQQWSNFRRVMDYFRRNYDLVVIDVNPGASLMTEVALDSTTHILSPVRPDRFSGHGLHLLDLMLEKLNIPSADIKLMVVMNGVKRGEAEEVEEKLRDPEQQLQMWQRDRKILESRIGYSKKLEARPAIAAPTDLTQNLAYQSGFGNHQIKKDLIAAAQELKKELGL